MQREAIYQTREALPQTFPRAGGGGEVREARCWACAWGLAPLGQCCQEVLHRGTVRGEGLQQSAVEHLW